MDCNIKLSIIVPIYNTANYLPRCLDSVLAAAKQTEASVEILLINDGSTDRSGEIVKEYCEKYPQWFRAFHKENGGLSDVKNYGLRLAEGEYVIFLDSDDYVETEMYRAMLAAAEKEQADVVACDVRLVYEDGRKDRVWACSFEAREDAFSKVIDTPIMASSCNKLVKRNLYDGLEFPKGLNNEDVAVTPVVLGRAHRICILDQPYYNYYQRNGSIQNTNFNEKRFLIVETAQKCIRELDGIALSRQEKIKGSLYCHQILAIALWPIREQPFLQRWKYLRKYMQRVNEMFTDLWENPEVQESLSWDGKKMYFYRKISYALMKRRCYLATAVFWSFCNVIYKVMKRNER